MAAPALTASGAEKGSGSNNSDNESAEDKSLRRGLLIAMAVLSGLLAVAACWLVWQAVSRAIRDDGLRFTSYWGGFGGAGTGWHIGPVAISLLSAALLVFAMAVVISGISRVLAPAGNAALAPKSDKSASGGGGK